MENNNTYIVNNVKHETHSNSVSNRLKTKARNTSNLKNTATMKETDILPLVRNI